MTKRIFAVTAAVLLLAGCREQPAGETLKPSGFLEEGMRFTESTMPIDGGLVIGNFGSGELDPLNNEGKGYLRIAKGDTVSDFVPADGTLNAPKGMARMDSLLFVADVGKIVVYNLKNMAAAPAVIPFPEGNSYVNDIAAGEGILFVSTTDGGEVFTLKPNGADSTQAFGLDPFCKIPGANGLALDGNTLYVASYPADGVMTPENCIYQVNITDPQPQKLSDEPGLYDGLAISPERGKLYFSDWNGNRIGSIDLKTGKREILRSDKDLIGPADISLMGDTLYVPYLVSGKVAIYTIE